jgi:uncharacterized membrane protein
MWDKFISAFEAAITTNAQGMFLFACGTAVMTILHILHGNGFVKGLKGANLMWESPEILTYFITWLLPEFLMADAWLGLRLSDAGYLILGEIVLFALMGRLGLEYMMSLKGRTITETNINVKSTETKKEDGDTPS